MIRLLLTLIAYGIVGCSISFPNPPPPAVIDPQLPPAFDAPIAIIEDRTVEVECLNWVDSPDHSTPCPAWSVVQVRRSTFAEAQAADLPQERYTVLEGEPIADEQAIAWLIRDNAPDFIAGNGGCRPGVRAIGQQVRWEEYQVITEYETLYEIINTCLVSMISEQMKIDGDGEVSWVSTRISGGEPADRSEIEFRPAGTGWYPLNDAGIGQNVTYELQFCEVEPCTERYYQNLIYTEIE
jgi:hypothetical protein